jgi:hypothetical protein
LRVVQHFVMLTSGIDSTERLGSQEAEGTVTILDDAHWWILLKPYVGGQWLHLADGRRLRFMAEGEGRTLHLRAIGSFEGASPLE